MMQRNEDIESQREEKARQTDNLSLNILPRLTICSLPRLHRQPAPLLLLWVWVRGRGTGAARRLHVEGMVEMEM